MEGTGTRFCTTISQANFKLELTKLYTGSCPLSSIISLNFPFISFWAFDIQSARHLLSSLLQKCCYLTPSICSHPGSSHQLFSVSCSSYKYSYTTICPPHVNVYAMLSSTNYFTTLDLPWYLAHEWTYIISDPFRTLESSHEDISK